MVRKLVSNVGSIKEKPHKGQGKNLGESNPSVSGAIGSGWSPLRNLEKRIVRGRATGCLGMKTSEIVYDRRVEANPKESASSSFSKRN